MKRLLLILVISSVFFISCEDESDEQLTNCEYSVELNDEYYQSAIQILLQNIINDPTHPDYYESEFNQDSVDYILSKLQAVRNLTIGDTLFNMYHYISPYIYNTKRLSVYVDSESNEAQSLIDDAMSGNTAFDLLVEDLDLGNYNTYDNEIEFQFNAENHMNFSALISQIEEFSFVKDVRAHSDLYMLMGEKREMQFNHMPNGISRLVFEWSVNDCIMSYTLGRWTFDVDEDCSAIVVEP